MRLPVDVNDLVKSGRGIREQREQVVRIAVFVESDAPDTLVAAVRSRLVPETANARIHVDVVGPADVLSVDMLADAVIALVGSGTMLPPSLAAVRDVGVPCVALVASMQREFWARKLDHPVRDVLGDEDLQRLAEKDLAGWMVDRLDTKKLALAANFSFVRRAVAHDSMQTTAFQNAAIGAVPFIPGADMPIMTANQMKMVLQIAAAYGEPMTGQRIRELAVVLGGGFLFRAIARTVADFVPGFGWAIAGGIGYTGTIAMGQAAIEYFEAGGTAAGLAEKIRETAEDVVERRRRGEPIPATAEVVGESAATGTSAAETAPGPAAWGDDPPFAAPAGLPAGPKADAR